MLCSVFFLSFLSFFCVFCDAARGACARRQGAPAPRSRPTSAILTASLTDPSQNYARKYKVAIDTVDFDFTILQKEGPESTAKPEDGC